MSSDLHREIEVPPYVVVIDAEEEWRPRPQQVIVLEGYRATAVITMLDGSRVSGAAAVYRIGSGGIFGDLHAALKDCEQRARDAIKEGFPG
jgi:aminoglycoside phosphotransferase